MGPNLAIQQDCHLNNSLENSVSCLVCLRFKTPEANMEPHVVIILFFKPSFNQEVRPLIRTYHVFLCAQVQIDHAKPNTEGPCTDLNPGFPAVRKQLSHRAAFC